MKSTTEASYLCSVITNTPDPGQEIRRKISGTMPVLRRLDIFWNETRSNVETACLHVCNREPCVVWVGTP